MATVKLAKLDREKRPETFSVELTDGTEVEFADPKKMPFGVLTEFDDLPPMDQLRYLTGAEGFDKLKNDPELDAEGFELVMKAWQEHYGMTTPGEAGSSSGS
jgi:hypothetical protein